MFFFRIQTSGLGGMKPNTVIVGWPNSWRKKEENGTQVFVNSIRYGLGCQGSEGIRQWTVNGYPFPMMIHKITLSVDYNYSI